MDSDFPQKNGRIVAMASQKGGVGKTTMSLNLAYYALASRSWKTLLVDTYPQGSIGYSIRGGVHRQPGLADVVAGSSPLADVVQHTRASDFDVLLFGQVLARRTDVDVFVTPEYKTTVKSVRPGEYDGVMALGSWHAPGLLELMVQCDAETDSLPFLVQLESPLSSELPIDTSDTVTWLAAGSALADIELATMTALSRKDLCTRRRGSDYLLSSILCRRSVSLHLDLLDGEQAHIEIVGGDLWNAYAGEESAMEALEHVLYGAVAEVLVRPLHAIPGERQIHHQGVQALSASSRRRIDPPPSQEPITDGGRRQYPLLRSLEKSATPQMSVTE